MLCSWQTKESLHSQKSKTEHSFIWVSFHLDLWVKSQFSIRLWIYRYVLKLGNKWRFLTFPLLNLNKNMPTGLWNFINFAFFSVNLQPRYNVSKTLTSHHKHQMNLSCTFSAFDEYSGLLSCFYISFYFYVYVNLETNKKEIAFFHSSGLNSFR